MTKQTISVMEEREKSIAICDECGLSEEDMPGELINFRPPQHSKADSLHYHESCLEDMGHADDLSQPLGEVIENDDGWMPGTGPQLVFDKMDQWIALVPVLFLWLSGATFNAGDLGAAAAFAVSSLGIVALVYWMGYTQFNREVFADD